MRCIRNIVLLFVCSTVLIATLISASSPSKRLVSYSGIYPHLAYYNYEGECGTGAVVPWANRLWVITYGPHLPFGSSDKLYEITPDLEIITRSESIGGTPANRMIHKESAQLFISHYAIDKNGNVRTIPISEMPGRLTGNARHLTDPANKIYFATMEEGFYEVNTKTLEVNTLYEDGNVNRKEGEMPQHADLLPGAHGKGLYSGQGVLVYSNNGEANYEALEQYDVESGVLAEWDGSEWTVVRRNQFVEVSGPGGIYGNVNPESDPIWATGWDHKSLIVGVRDPNTAWHFYRLPKASHSYDGAHGWNTEWPRIRNVGTDKKPDYLMTMHGMFWHFPEGFTKHNSAGIRPRSAYLKVIGDFTRWNNQLVFGCDDSAHREFLNKRKAKGNIEGPGQSNSNLWFTSIDLPDKLGPSTAGGAVWFKEKISAGDISEPFLFSGWDTRSAWIKNHGDTDGSLVFEIDRNGNNEWIKIRTITIEAGSSVMLPFNKALKGEWIRVVSSNNITATVHFNYSQTDKRKAKADKIFNGIATSNSTDGTGGLLWGLGDNRRTLGVLAHEKSDKGWVETAYYELDAEMNLVKKEDPETAGYIRQRMSIPHNVVTIDEASALIVDDKGRRWRLPIANSGLESLTNNGQSRICREVATERDLFNCMGTFFELPAENADGYAKIRPVSSHPFTIHDYASYRGLLIMSGMDTALPKNNEHIIQSADGKVALWAGAIDDLWKLGKPVGKGGPWFKTLVEPNVASDPYLIGFYDKRSIELSHDSNHKAVFTIQADPMGNGTWMDYQSFEVLPDSITSFDFPVDFQARWVRVLSDTKCRATAILTYK